MDDRELEARLARRLRQRFDAIEPPADLLGAVHDLVAGAPHPARWTRMWREQVRTLAGLAAAAVTVALLAALVMGLGGGYRLLPSVEPSPTSGPSAAVASTPVASQPGDNTRWIVILPRDGSLPTKAESDAAATVFGARLRAYETENFSMAVGDGFIIESPALSGSPTELAGLFRLAGEVAIVPLPTADYHLDTQADALLGSTLPVAERPLFTASAFASVSPVRYRSFEPLRIQLTQAALGSFAEYSRSHIGGYLAALLDGRVAGFLRLDAPVLNGSLTFSVLGLDRSLPFPQIGAAFAAGPLPVAWQDPVVPGLAEVETARALALGQFGGRTQATVVRIEIALEGSLRLRDLHAVWHVVVVPRDPAAGGPRTVVLDGETAAFIRFDVAP